MSRGAPPLSSLLSRSPTVNDQLAPSDKRRLIRGQLQHTVGHIFRGSYTSHWQTLQALLPLRGVFERVLDHICGNRTRMHRVAANLVLGVLGRGGLGEKAHGALGRRVG